MKNTSKRVLTCLLATLFILSMIALAACNNGNGIITVSYDKSHTICVGDDLETIKPYLTVTYTDSDGNTTQIDDFTLIGTLTEGECELTVVYNGMTSKVTVDVKVNPATCEHSYSAWQETTPATCKSTGEMQRVCSICDSFETQTIAAIEHTPKAATKEDVIPSTCTEQGSYNLVVRCDKCDAILSSTPQTTQKKDHDLGKWIDEIAATCSQNGIVGHHTCSDCGNYFDKDHNKLSNLTIATTGHNYTNGFCQACGKSINVASKTATSITINLEKWQFKVNRYDNPSIRAYLWRTNACYVADSSGAYHTIWSDSDSDGVVKISGEDDFIGGYHGDEIQTSVKIFVDGVEYKESSTFDNLEFKEILIICESDVYHCNTSTNADTVAFKRNKVLKFNSDGYTVENYWVAQEALTLEVSYIGMLSVNCADTDGTPLANGFYSNSDYKYYSAKETVAADTTCKDVEFTTKYGNIGIKICDYSPTTNYSAWVTYYPSSDRNKVYCATNRTSNTGAINSGDVIKGKAVIYLK